MWSEASTLATAGPDLSFNTGGVGDDFYLDPEQCSWTPDVRLEVEDAPRTDGAIIFPPLKGAGHLRLGGRLKPSTDDASSRDAMAATMRAAADALMGADGTFTHPTRGSLTVRLEVYPQFTGAFRKDFVIVLIAADPGTW